MKKLMLVLTACCLIFASCGKKTQPAVEVTQEEQKCCELTAEEKAMFDTWENWANIASEEQVKVVADFKTWIDAKMAECKEKAENAEGECPVKKAECEAKCAAFMEKWDQFETLTLDAQKELIDEFLSFKKDCKKDEVCEKAK